MAIEKRQFDWMDEVQADIVRSQINTYIRIMSWTDGLAVDFERQPHEVHHAPANVIFTASSQGTVQGPEGRVRLKIKTGRTKITLAEEAVLLAGVLDGPVEVLEVSLADGQLRTLEMGQAEQGEHLSKLSSIWDSHNSTTEHKRAPGRHCMQCPRPAVCGQYPQYGTQRIRNRTRTILVPKKWLLLVETCHRQVAWRRLHGIPDDSGYEYEPFGTGGGLQFHEVIATALKAENPERAFDDLASAASASEQQSLRWLFERHQTLTATEPHPVTIKEVEYDLGVTLVVNGLDIDSRDQVVRGDVAVVLTARVDAAGREEDDTPAIIEHRTGSQTHQSQHEQDLYALGAALLTRREKVAVHIHRLGLQDGPACERLLYLRDDLDAAARRLTELAETIASWHPTNSLHPEYRVGAGCASCPFEDRCIMHRGPELI